MKIEIKIEATSFTSLKDVEAVVSTLDTLRNKPDVEEVIVKFLAADLTTLNFNSLNPKGKQRVSLEDLITDSDTFDNGDFSNSMGTPPTRIDEDDY